MEEVIAPCSPAGLRRRKPKLSECIPCDVKEKGTYPAFLFLFEAVPSLVTLHTSVEHNAFGYGCSRTYQRVYPESRVRLFITSFSASISA